MRILVALGGNALIARGQAMTASNQRANVRKACEALAPLAKDNELIITHGNGPQVGLLALQAQAYSAEDPYPLDILGAQTEGMIGYLIEQELGNLLPFEKEIATILTMTEVSLEDPAFDDPTKFVGPVYDEETARQLAQKEGWVVKPDGPYFRRVVASPKPLRVFEKRPIEILLESGAVVVCAGGGGIPTAYNPTANRVLGGAEAVIDKDLASAVVARDLGVDQFIIATDADGVYVDWGKPNQRRITQANPDELARFSFPAGSMGPKVEAAIEFARSGHDARIGSLADLDAVIDGIAGTRVSLAVPGIEMSDPESLIA